MLEEREFAGTLDFVGTGVDPQNRTIPVEILLDNRDRLIRPRMVANVQVERLRLDRVIVVPQDLVQRTESGFQVFVAERDGAAVTAQARAVELGPSYADRVVIETGLDFGDRLIVSGHRQVDDGSAIRVGAALTADAAAGADPTKPHHELYLRQCASPPSPTTALPAPPPTTVVAT